MGDGVWPVMAALLPRAAQIQVRRGQALPGSTPGPCAISLRASLRRAWGRTGDRVRHAACQVSSGGDVKVVSGAGAKGTSWMRLSGGTGLGPDGAERLAELLREAPPPMLAALDLRHLAAFFGSCL